MFVGSPATVTIEDNDGERFYIEGKQSADLLERKADLLIHVYIHAQFYAMLLLNLQLNCSHVPLAIIISTS